MTAPVFLFCSERSGSNLIATIVGAHSGFYALPPVHFGREILLNLAEIRKGGPEGAAWDKAQNWVKKRLSTFVSKEAAAASETRLKALQDLSPDTLIRTLYLDTFPQAAGKRVFIKENNLQKLLYFILASFPDAKFVFQVRDPRDYLASAKAVGKGEGNKFGSDRNALKVWREDQEGGLQALGFLGENRVFLHRYEDLLSAPEAVLTRLCAFLEVPFEPEMMDFHQTDAAQNLAGTNKQRANVGKPLMADNFAKYRTSLTAVDIRKVEKRVGDLMELFGYPLELTKSKSPKAPLLTPLVYDSAASSRLV